MANTQIDLDRFAKGKVFAFGTTVASGGGLVTINNGTAATSTVGLAVVGSQTIGGNLTITGNLTVIGSITEQTVINLQVTNKDIRVNYGGTTAGASGAGLTVEGTSAATIGAFYYDATKASKFTIGDGTTQNEVVDVSSIQTITNKIIAGSQITGNIAGSAGSVTGVVAVANGGSGASTLNGVLIGNGTSAFTTKISVVGNFVGDTDTQTLTNKTLTSPKINQINDVINNLAVATFTSPASSVNQIANSSSITGVAPSVAAVGADANIALNLVSKGTSSVQANGVVIADISTAQTFTNKSISGGQINSGTLGIVVGVGQGGTGVASLNSGSLLVGNGSGAVTLLAAGTAGNILVSNGTTFVSQVMTSPTAFKKVALTPAPDGTIKIFTIGNAIIVNSDLLFVTGMPLINGALADYTITGTTLTFTTGFAAPLATDTLILMGEY